jgi:hypothetical protein
MKRQRYSFADVRTECKVNFDKEHSNLEHGLRPWRHSSFCRSIRKRNILHLSYFRRVHAAPSRMDSLLYIALVPLVVHVGCADNHLLKVAAVPIRRDQVGVASVSKLHSNLDRYSAAYMAPSSISGTDQEPGDLRNHINYTRHHRDF